MAAVTDGLRALEAALGYARHLFRVCSAPCCRGGGAFLRLAMSDTTGAGAPVIDCLKTISLDGTLQAIDRDGQCLMEIDDFSDVSGQLWASLWPAESRYLVSAAVQTALEGKVARFSADCPTAKGTVKSWEVSVAPIRNATGEVVALQSLSQDVTRRERDRRETAIVSQELAHRIKNLFTIVDSLIHLSARTDVSSGSFVASLRERLKGLGRAIAYIHPMDAEDMASAPRTLKGLIAALIAPYEAAGAHLSVTGDDADVGQSAVTSVAMVLNELATNAVKYGALRDGDGTLSIRLSRLGSTILIEWHERGLGSSGRGEKPGFGTSLLDRTVKFQLGGAIERDWEPDGLTVRLELPLSRLADA